MHNTPKSPSGTSIQDGATFQENRKHSFYQWHSKVITSPSASQLFAMKKINHDMYLGAGAHLFEIARDLRLHETQAEQFLWSRLCANKLGVKFRRQHPIYNYVADFYCHSHRLVIEIDGSVHNSKQACFDDSARSKAFEEFSITVMRFTNNDVLFAIEEVIRKVKSHLDEPR